MHSHDHKLQVILDNNLQMNIDTSQFVNGDFILKHEHGMIYNGNEFYAISLP